MKKRARWFVCLLLSLMFLATSMLIGAGPAAASNFLQLNALSPGDTVNFAGYTWIVLNPGTGYVLMQDSYGSPRAFDSSNDPNWSNPGFIPTFDPTNQDNIAYYLNNTFYNSLPAADQNGIQSSKWTTGNETNESASSVNCKIGLLSCSEGIKYQNVAGVINTSFYWWTRTTRSGSPGGVWAGGSGGINDNGAPGSDNVRPALYLNPQDWLSKYDNTITNDDADLSGLTLSAGTLAPAFDATTDAYTDSVGFLVSSITVTPTADYYKSTITVNGSPVASGSASGSIGLNIGSNNITVAVTAVDGATDAYAITVDRAAFSIIPGKIPGFPPGLTTPGPAAQLTWTTQPGGAAAGANLSPQPVLALEDAGGNVETGDNSDTVTVALTAPNGATLSGTAAMTLSGGIATFNGLSVSTAGSYTLTATCSLAGITGPVSNSFTITAAAPGTPGTPGTSPTVLVFTLGSSDYTLNGQTQSMDTVPIISGSRILLPIRFVATPLGATVDWDAVHQEVTVSLNGNTIELWIGQDTAQVNGASKPIYPTNPDVTPVIVPPGRTMLPLRFIAENMGCTVVWNGNARQATVTYP